MESRLYGPRLHQSFPATRLALSSVQRLPVILLQYSLTNSSKPSM